MSEPIPIARGRRANARPRHLFKDSGIEVELHKLSPTTLQRLAETIRREAAAFPAGHPHKMPEPPIERVDVGGEIREERNERHPDYLAALEKWSQWAMAQTNERFLRIAAVSAIEPLDTTQDEISTAASRIRRVMAAEGVELPAFDQYTQEENDRIIWLLHVAISTTEDLQEFYQALTQRNQVQEEAVAAHVATFPAAGQSNGHSPDVEG